MVKVSPRESFPMPVTLIPSYPDLPMEDVYPRIPETDIRGVYLRKTEGGRVAYFPGDIDRTFWQVMCADHGTLLRNTIRWALNEEPVAEIDGPGVLDVTAWRQKDSMTIHLVNLTNPMMMKGPFRELIPVSAEASIRIPEGLTAKGVHLLISGKDPVFKISGNKIELSVPEITDHEIIGIDLA
jgi:hypothetical protein